MIRSNGPDGEPSAGCSEPVGSLGRPFVYRLADSATALRSSASAGTASPVEPAKMPISSRETEPRQRQDGRALTRAVPLPKIAKEACASALSLEQRPPWTGRKPTMHIIDSHFHWWPRSVFEQLCKRRDFPRAERQQARAATITRRDRAGALSTAGRSGSISTSSSRTWTGSAIRSTWSARSGRSRWSSPNCRWRKAAIAALMWNEEMAGAQRKYPGPRLGQRRGAAAVDTGVAIEVLDHAINKLGLDGREPAGQRRQRSAHRC